MKRNKRLFGFLTLCVAPATILFFIFMILPTFNVFKLSLYDKARLGGRETYIGFKNFEVLFKNENFITAMQNMILLVVITTLVTFAFALVFASILTREKIKGQNFFRIVFYIPNILSIVVIAGIFSAMYDADGGLLTLLVKAISGKTILWKSDVPMIAVIIAMIWQAIGYYMVMYMASMSAVSESLYESANLDGAGRLTQFFQITIPLVWTNIRTTLTFFIISNINLGFMLVTTMLSTDANQQVALSYMYNQVNFGAQGFGMAAGVVLFLFSFLLSLLVNRVTDRETLEY